MRRCSNLMASPPGLGAVRLKTPIHSGRFFGQLGVLLVAANRSYCPNSSVGRSSEDRHKWDEQAGPSHLLLAYLRTRLADRHPPSNAAQWTFPREHAEGSLLVVSLIQPPKDSGHGALKDRTDSQESPQCSRSPCLNLLPMAS